VNQGRFGPAQPATVARLEVLGFVHASNGNIQLHLRHGNRLALRLDCEAVLLEIAGGEVRTNAGDNLAYRADGGWWSNKAQSNSPRRSIPEIESRSPSESVASLGAYSARELTL
jgi:hypothetical protein